MPKPMYTMTPMSTSQATSSVTPCQPLLLQLASSWTCGRLEQRDEVGHEGNLSHVAEHLEEVGILSVLSCSWGRAGLLTFSQVMTALKPMMFFQRQILTSVKTPQQTPSSTMIAGCRYEMNSLLSGGNLS